MGGVESNTASRLGLAPCTSAAQTEDAKDTKFTLSVFNEIKVVYHLYTNAYVYVYVYVYMGWLFWRVEPVRTFGATSN